MLDLSTQLLGSCLRRNDDSVPTLTAPLGSGLRRNDESGGLEEEVDLGAGWDC